MAVFTSMRFIIAVLPQSVKAVAEVCVLLKIFEIVWRFSRRTKDPAF